MPDLATKADFQRFEALITSTGNKATIRLGVLAVALAGLTLVVRWMV